MSLKTQKVGSPVLILLLPMSRCWPAGHAAVSATWSVGLSGPCTENASDPVKGQCGTVGNWICQLLVRWSGTRSTARIAIALATGVRSSIISVRVPHAGAFPASSNAGSGFRGQRFWARWPVRRDRAQESPTISRGSCWPLVTAADGRLSLTPVPIGPLRNVCTRGLWPGRTTMRPPPR
jgi:hypothetical protein